MTHTATNHPSSTTGRRRVPAAIALAMAAGLALAGCSSGEETAGPASPTSQTTTSSSSTSSSTPTALSAAPVSASAAAVPPAAPTPSASPQLPANVVGTGGPCHILGELAQAEDGSPLFCTEDPGGAGPLWLPQPAAGPDGTGPALAGQPCLQQDAAVTTPEGTVLTCRLTGGGDVPGGLFWLQ